MMEQGALHGNHSCASTFSTPPQQNLSPCRGFSISRLFLCSSLIAAEAQGDKGRRKAGLSTLRAWQGAQLWHPAARALSTRQKLSRKLAQLQEHPRVGDTKERGSGGRDRLWRGCGCFFRPLWLLQTRGSAWVKFCFGRGGGGWSEGQESAAPASQAPVEATIPER